MRQPSPEEQPSGSKRVRWSALDDAAHQNGEPDKQQEGASEFPPGNEGGISRVGSSDPPEEGKSASTGEDPQPGANESLDAKSKLNSKTTRDEQATGNLEVIPEARGEEGHHLGRISKEETLADSSQAKLGGRQHKIIAEPRKKQPVQPSLLRGAASFTLKPITSTMNQASAPLFMKLSSVEMGTLRQEFKAALNTLPNESREEKEVREGPKPFKKPISEESYVQAATLRIFRIYCKKKEGETGKHANSMDLEEYLMCLEKLRLLPRAVSKRAAMSLFKEINGMRAADYDGHQFSQFEFLKSLEILAKRTGFAELADLFLTSEQRRRIFGVSNSNTGDEPEENVSLADVKTLGDLRLEHMRALLRLFKDLTVETAVEPELPMDVFVKAFQPVLKLPENEIALLFMKIDVNSDGAPALFVVAVFLLGFKTLVYNIQRKQSAPATVIHMYSCSINKCYQCLKADHSKSNEHCPCLKTNNVNHAHAIPHTYSSRSKAHITAAHIHH
jgi:hypothetical protein